MFPALYKGCKELKSTQKMDFNLLFFLVFGFVVVVVVVVFALFFFLFAKYL